MSELARAVLYEGYLLWPYRRSSLKNQQRFAMNNITPPTADSTTGNRSSSATQVLVELDSAAAKLAVTVRFLHIVERLVLRDDIEVDEARVSGNLYQSWEEARERELELAPIDLAERTGSRTLSFAVPAGYDDERIDSATVLRRRWRGVEGALRLETTSPATDVRALSVRLSNTTVCDSADAACLRHRGLASAHLVLRIEGGAFVSSQDPPRWLRDEADRCVDDGLWPVLVGEPGDRHSMLAAPMVLYDWPRVAPESPGDLFDATEIDQLLVLNVLSMSDAEKEEMAAADPKARAILDRCSSLSHEEMMGLHGTLRDVGKETW